MADLTFRGNGDINAGIKPPSPEEIKKKQADAAAEKANEPVVLGAPTATAEETRANEAEAYRFILNGGAKPIDPIKTPDDAIIKDLVDKHYDAVFAESKARLDKLAPITAPAELSPEDKDNYARRLWQQIAEDRSTHRMLDDQQKYVMMEFALKNHEEVDRIRNTYGQHQSIFTHIKDGAWSYIKSIPTPAGSIGQALGVVDSANAKGEQLNQQKKERADGISYFWNTLKEYKENPKNYRKEVVDDILAAVKENPDLLTKDELAKNPKVAAQIKSLNRVEYADFMLALREKKHGSGIQFSFPALRITDFDLRSIDAIPEWDDSIYSAVSFDHENTVNSLLALSDPALGGMGQLTGEDYRKFKDPKTKAQNDLVWKLNKQANESNLVDPATFAIHGWGRMGGVFSYGTTELESMAKSVGGVYYNMSPMGIADGALSGAVILGRQIVGTPLDPTGAWGHFKTGKWGDWWRMMTGEPSLQDPKVMVASFDAAMRNQDAIEEHSSGQRSVLGSRILSAVSSYTTEEVQAAMHKYGAMNAELVNVGMMRIMPSALVGRAGAIGKAGMIEGRGVLGAFGQGIDSLAANGVIRMATKNAINGRLLKYGSYLEAAEGWTLGLPVKAVGFALNRGGKLIVGTMGMAGNSIIKLAEVISEKTGSNIDPTLIKNTLKTIGITDAFLGFGWSRQAAAIFGFGKGAKEIGGILERYGYRDTARTGVGLVSTLEAIEADTTLTGVTRFVAGKGARLLGPLTSGFYDTAKGSWHGAGVGYGLGFLQDGMRGGIDGMWGGVGMGGMGGAHMSWAQYRSGATTHMGAVAEIRKHAKGTTNEQVVEDIIAGAEHDRDWNRVAMLVGAHRMANGINTKMIIHREGDVAHINGDILKLDQVLDTDFNIGGRQYRVRELKAEVERLHKQAESEAMNDATRDKAAETRRIAGEKNAELQKEVNDWLSDVRTNGSADQRQRINTRQNAYNGVFIEGGAGNGTIYINADRSGLVGGSGYATNTVAAHEVFHAIQKTLFREQTISHFANTLWGISAEGGKLVLQKGAMDASILKEFSDLYAKQLHQGDEAGAKKALDDIHSAWEVINNENATELQVKGSKDILHHYAEEFGAYYFESYISRHKADFMFRGGNGSGLRRIMNQVENYIDFQTKLDLNGQGISLRLKEVSEERDSKDAKETVRKLTEIGRQGKRLRESLEQLVVRNPDGTVAKITDEVMYDALLRKYQKLATDKIALERTLKKAGVGEIFRDKSGNFLVVEAADRAMADIMKRLSNKGANNAFDLNGLPPNELISVLTRAGLEHWVDSEGKLKSPEVIEKERADRGNKMLTFFESQNPVVTGIVVTTDKHGNKRGTGMITNEGLKVLKDSGMLLPTEVIKLAAMRDVINAVNGINPLGGGEVQFIYNALTHEYIAEDGQVDRLRKPKNNVLPSFRSVVPYKMEFVMTSKDRNGNTVTPHFEVMVTAIDMGVVLERAADEFNKNYTLPSGAVINVADLFGGSMEVMKHHLRRYTENLSEGGLPSAELFGGGEQGAAVRDIMFRILGAIPKGGFGPNGEALLYNNPIIRPFHAWERGPKFAFTTFRLDLMQDINVTTGNFKFNETTGYPKAAGNYQPPQFGSIKVIEKDGQKISTMDARYTFEKVNKKTGIISQSTTRYTITSDNKRWSVAANDFDKPYVFSTIEQAKDFIHLDSQRRQLIGANQLPAHLMGGDSGIVVANIDGNYLLIDTKKKNKIVAGRTYRGEQEAIIEAAKMHNKLLLDNLRSSKHPSLRLFETQLANIERVSANNPELLPARLDMAKDGTPKTEAVKDKDGKEIKYTANDIEVKRGLVKIGATKRVLKFQKASYGLMETMLGSNHYSMGDAATDAAASQLAQHIFEEAMEATKDPEKRKGLGWYRNMVRDGYGIFGSVYGMFAESQGATSARTPVAENFKQAEEALSMFSRGKYNDTLTRIHQQLKEIHEKASRKDPTTGISEFEAEALDLLYQKEAAKEANASNQTDYEWDDIVNFRNLKGEDAIPESVVRDFLESYSKLQEGPKRRLTTSQLSEGMNAAKSKVFRDNANLMLRENGKKYNANTVKVGQVMYNIWHELTEGPKTPNFAGNLAGITRDATIDVWAARTLHRIINSKIKGRSIWRLSAGMETGVDYIWHNHGTAEMPKWEGGGDFFFGQLAFEKAAAKLREQGGDYAEIQPDDLQALMWFHEKGLWEKKGWTQTIGAEMSSFEGPMSQFSGAKDPARIDDYQNIRRLLAGFAGSYDSVGVAQIRGVPMDARGSGRRFAFPKEKIEQIGGFVADTLGSALRGSNIGQTIGVTAGKAEHSLMFDVIAHRGNLTVLANAHGVLLKKANNEARLLQQYSEQLAAEIDFNKRGILENKIKDKEKAFDKAKAAADKAESDLKKEQTDPTIKNQMGLLAEYLVAQAKNYSQKDVYVAELVGENHPNARPAGDIMFGSHMSQQDAMLIAKTLSDASPYIDGFTLIPDPRNPNSAEISRLSNEISKLDPNGEQAKALQKKINALTRYIGVQAVCTPELTARNREFSKIPEVRDGKRDLLTEPDAKWYMGEWQRTLKELIESKSNTNGTQLRLNAFHLSAETIPRGSFDTFNSAEIGRDVPLSSRLQRYKNGLERESALTLENERTGDLFTADSTALSDNRTTWSPTSTERGVGGGVSDALATDAQGQGKASSKGNVVLTAEKATQWIKDKLKTPIITSEGGVVWGDKDFQITQKRDKDGKLTNVFEVIGAFDRKPTVVTGKKQAEAHLMGRLTGEIAAKGGERIIEVNGEQFKVNEATNPIFATDSAALVNIGVYPDTSNIFKYRPDDSPTIEFHPWNSKTVEEVFPKNRSSGSSPPIPFSHRTAKYVQRLNSLIQRLSSTPFDAEISLQLTSSGWDTAEHHNGIQYGTHHHRNFEVTIIATAPTTSSAYPTGRHPYRIADTHGSVSLSTITDQQLYHSSGTNSSRHPQPKDAANRTGTDHGSIGGTHAMDGTTYQTVKALDTLLNDARLMSEFEQAYQKQRIQLGPKYAVRSEFAFLRQFLTDKYNQLFNEYSDKKVDMYGKGTGTNPDGTMVAELQNMLNEVSRIQDMQRGISRSTFAALAEHLSIDPTIKNMADLAYEIQGAGDAVNAEVGARFKAGGMLSEGTQGLSSYIVNKTGGVFKNRRNTYGEGNTRFQMHDSNNTDTRDSATAIDINISERASANITTYVEPKRLFSPSNITFERAFNDSASKGRGNLFSDYAEHNLPRNAIISYESDSAGNIRVEATNSETGNTVMSFQISASNPNKEVTVSQAFVAETPEGIASRRESKWHKEETDSKGVLRFASGRSSGRQIIVDELAGHPDLKTSVVRETLERLRHTGTKSMFYDSFDAQNIHAAIKDAFGKDPELSQEGWEANEDGWNIDPKTKYSPSFVPFERLFDETGVKSGDQFWSKTAARALAGNYSLDFEQVKDAELREGMTDAPMGANGMNPKDNPMSFITLRDSGYRGSAAEFYVMQNREAPEGRPNEARQMAVLQMRKKADHITIEPIVGALAEIVERLKMSGVTQLWIPREGHTAADYRKMTDQFVDTMSKLHENEYDVDGAEADRLTTVDEHDGLRIVFAGSKNPLPSPLTTKNGPVDIYRIDRSRKYSPSFIRFDQAFPSDTANLKNGGLFSDRARESLGGFDFNTSGLYATQNKKAIRETQGRFKGSRVSLTDADGKEVFGIIVRTSESASGRDVSGKAELKFFKFDDPTRRRAKPIGNDIISMRGGPRRQVEGAMNEPAADNKLLKGFLSEIVERLKYAGFNQVSFDYSTAAKDSFVSEDTASNEDGVIRGRRIGAAQHLLTEVMGENPTIGAAKQDSQGMIPSKDSRPDVGEMYSRGGMTAFTEGNTVDGKYVTESWLPAWKINPKRKYSPSGHPEDSFVDRILKVNIEKFGLTRDPYEGGYLLPNGSMLDLSGRRDASGFKREGDYYVPSGRNGRDDFAGQRYTDHREVILPDGIKAPVGAHEASRYNMVKAMQATGAIRMSHMSDHTLLDIGLKPTSSQLSMIKDLIRDSNDKRSIQLDLRDTTRPDENGWEREAGLSYPEGTDPNKVVRDINRFYAGNDVKPDFSPSNYGSAESVAAGEAMNAGAKYKENPYMASSMYYSVFKSGAIKQGQSADWWAYWSQNGGTLADLVFVWQMAHDVNADSKSISQADFRDLVTRQLAHGNLKWDKMTPREQNALDMFLFMDAYSSTTYEKGADSLGRELLSNQITLDVRNERSNAKATAETDLMVMGDRWQSTSPDFSTVIEEWNHMLYGSMMNRDAGEHKSWDVLLNPPSLLDSRRQAAGSRTKRRFNMTEGEATEEGLSPIPKISLFKDAPSYVAAMRNAMAERLAFMKEQHTKSSKLYRSMNNVDLPPDASQELTRDIIRQAAFHTIVESWLRILEGTQARDMASMRDSIYVRSARKKLGREPSAADIAFEVDPNRFRADGTPRQPSPTGFTSNPVPKVGGAGYKYAIENARTYSDPKDSPWAKDYNFVTIVEYVAGILKSPQTQVYLTDLPPMEKSPLDDILQHIEQNGEGEGKQYATELNSLWSKSLNAFQQLLASVRLYAQVFSSKTNWKDKMLRGEVDPRKGALDNYTAAPENKKRTLLDDAVKAAFLIRPRSLTTETTTYQRRNQGTTETATFTASGLDAVARALQSVRTRENVRDNQGTIQMGTEGAIGQFMEARKKISEGENFVAQQAEQARINAVLEANLKAKMKGTKAGEKDALKLYAPKRPDNTVIFVPSRRLFWALETDAQMHKQDSRWDGRASYQQDANNSINMHYKATTDAAGAVWKSFDTPEIRDLVAQYQRLQTDGISGTLEIPHLYRSEGGYGWAQPQLYHDQGAMMTRKQQESWIKAMALHAPDDLIPIQVPKKNAEWFKKHFGPDPTPSK